MRILVISDATGFMQGGVPVETARLICGLSVRGHALAYMGDIPIERVRRNSILSDLIAGRSQPGVAIGTGHRSFQARYNSRNGHELPWDLAYFSPAKNRALGFHLSRGVSV